MQVKNIYEDEKQKIEQEIKAEVELSFKVNELLKDYGYKMEAVLKNGLPDIQFTRV